MSLYKLSINIPKKELYKRIYGYDKLQQQNEKLVDALKGLYQTFDLHTCNSSTIVCWFCKIETLLRESEVDG